MKKVYTLLFIFSFIMSFDISGQNIIPEITMGWGVYSLEELKEISGTINSPVQLRTVNNYPPYYFYKASLLYELYVLRFGFSWAHYSTGARDHYGDYSGEISVKQLIRTNVYSFPFYLNVNRDNRLNFMLMVEPGIMSTNYIVQQYARVWDESSESEFSDGVTSLSLQPGFKLSYTIKRWQPSLNFGYFFDTKFIVTTGYRQIRVYWEESDYFDISGVRLSVSLAYRIGK